MRVQDAIRPSFSMELRSASIFSFQKKLNAQDIDSHWLKHTCSKKACSKRNTASLKRRQRGLGIPKHMKIMFISIDISFVLTTMYQYTLSLLNRAIILPCYWCLLRLESSSAKLKGTVSVRCLLRSSLLLISRILQNKHVPMIMAFSPTRDKSQGNTIPIQGLI